MALLLFLLILSFFFTSVLILPFINLLYHLKIQRQKQQTRDIFARLTPIFDKFHKKKVGTPLGGGILIIFITTSLFFLSMILFNFFWVPVTSIYPLKNEIIILLFTFLSFGILGFYDDLKKTFLSGREKSFGLRFRHKLILQLILGTIISLWLYYNLKINIINVPFIGVLNLGFLSIPFSTLVIVGFANAYNITDGLDGLAAGLLLIALLAFWTISASILDTPLSIFIALWLGSLVAFLYFNIYPARIFLGDAGALSFGATLAVIGLLLGKAFVLLVIGGVYIIEILSSFLQLAFKAFFKRKIFPVAPFHLFLQDRGWEEPKIVMRAWLAGVMFAVFGLLLAFLK